MISPELRDKINDFLTSLQSTQTLNGRRALVSRAGLDEDLKTQIEWEGAQGVFCQLFLSTLVSYGTLETGQNALEAVLEAAKQEVGQDRKKECDDLIQEWRAFRKESTSNEDHPKVLPPHILEQPTGAIPLDSPFYIERAADAQMMQQLKIPRTITTIRGARQTGKTSLVIRGVEFAKKRDETIVIHLDCQGIFDRFGRGTLDECFKHWAYAIADEANLGNSYVDSIWQEQSTPKLKMTRFFEDSILKGAKGFLVLAMDETDVLLEMPFYEGFFGLLRSWYNKGASEDLWKKLNIVIAISTYPSLFIRNIHESPFNVGRTIELQDFSKTQVQDLNGRYNEPLKPTQMPEVMELLGGHPYLIQQALHTLTRESMTWSELSAIADKRNGPFFFHHLYPSLKRLLEDKELLNAMHKVLTNGTCPEGNVFDRLDSVGLIKRQDRKCVCRYGLYEQFFRSQLL